MSIGPFSRNAQTPEVFEAQSKRLLARIAELQDETRLLRKQLRTYAQEAVRAAGAKDRKDAERYRWLRERMKVREEKSLAGSWRDSIYIRIGQSFFDTPTRGSKGYTEPAQYERECQEFDAAVDAAIAATTAGEAR